MGHEKHLSAVVGFTDRSGRTSCALNETEHYRLRTLGLLQLAKSMHKRSYQNKQWLLLWHSRNRYIAATSSAASLEAKTVDDAPSGDGRQGRVSEGEVQRGKILMATKRNEIPQLELKQANAEAELRTVLPRYIDLVHPNIFPELYEKLPRELRDVVYSCFDTFTDDIKVKHSTGGTDGVPTSPFFDGDCSTHAWDRPWYFDPGCVGPDLAREMVELQYGRSRFYLNDHALIPRLLDEDRWKTGVIPWNHIRQIELDILDESEFEVEAAQKQLRYRLELLHQLEPGAKISLNLFNLPPSSYDGSQLCESRWEEERSLVTSNISSSSSAAHAMSIYVKLAPVIRDLEQHGHTIVFVDRSSRDDSKLSMSWWDLRRRGMTGMACKLSV